MRLDKYLKVARIVKRRTVSKELADKDRVLINGHLAKPSSEVKVGDILTLVFGYRELSVRVLMLSKQVSKSDASLLFEIIEEKAIKTDIPIEN